MNFYKILFKKLILSISFIFLFRLLFLFYHLDLFKRVSIFEILKALFLGFRFDLSTSLILLLPSFFILSLPINNFIKKRLSKFIFLITHLGAFVFLVADLEYFSFVGKKITIDLLSFGENDFSDQSFQLLLYYSPLVFLFLFISFIFYKLIPSDFNQVGRWYKKLIINFFIIAFSFIGIRGGLQMRSLSAKDAFIFEQHELGNLALNPIYTLIRSFGKEGLKKVTYFKSDAEAKDIILKKREFNKSLNYKNQNVVIFILESFSYEYFVKGHMPFLKKLCEKSFCSPDSFANGRRSIEAMPSILASMPSLMDDPLYKSQYQSTYLYSLPEALKSEGYDTSFYHGGKRGTMGFDSFAKSIGFKDYFGLEDYPDQNDFDGHWGIYDDRYLKYFKKELSLKKPPFFSTLFTLSSHQPYSIPPEFHGRFHKGELAIHESIEYTDFSLSEFFKEAQQESWYENTLFVFTADHTSKLETAEFNSTLGKFRIPIIFYHPKIDLSLFNQDRVVSQIDIFPSVLNFLGIKPKYDIVLGGSIFNGRTGETLNKVNDLFLYISKDYYLEYNGEKVNTFKRTPLRNEGEKILEIPSSPFLRLKSMIQYYTNGLRKNKLYPIDN